MTSPAARRALLFVNPHARSVASPLNAVRDTLMAGGITPVARDCRGHDRLTDLLRDEERHVAIAVIGDGDGTLNGAAAALAELHRPLGVLAPSTADHFARVLALPPEPVAAARLICGCEPRPEATDGESVTTTPATFAVRPGALFAHAPPDRSRTPAAALETAPLPAALSLNSASF